MGFSFFQSRPIFITPRRLIYLLTLIAITSFTLAYGFQLRIDLYNWTSTIHHDDLYGARRRGQIIAREGIFSIYDRIAEDSRLEYAGIDYAPLRVLTIGRWTQWFELNHPDERWTTRYEHVYPLLMMNTICELVSAITIFLLIYHWLNRIRPADSSWMYGLSTALIGALLFWFNPALLWNAHCWPQWDVWLVPFFLLSVYLSSKNYWFSAGVSIAIGTFFKGQILLVAPLLLLWPIFQLRWREPIRLISGFVTGSLLIALPWMGSGPTAAGAIVVMLTINIFSTIAKQLRPRIFSATDWRALHSLIGSLLLFFILPHLGTSMNWYAIGFEFGTHKFPNLASASGTYSIPTILRDYFNFPNDMDTPISIAGYMLPVRKLMFMLYGVCLLLCAAAAARLDQKNSPAFLLTIVTPWICFFMLLTQMNNRYLVWGAMFAASLTIAVNRGLFLLGILLSLICTIGMAQHMLPSDPSFAPQTTRWVAAMETHLAWPVAMIGLIFLYQTMASCRFFSIKPGLPADPGT